MSGTDGTSDVAPISMRAATFRRAGPSYGLGTALLAMSRWMRSRGRAALVRRASRRLSVTETVSLGEKRFVSILCVDGEQFLLGGSPSNVVLLAKLDKSITTSSGQASAGESFSELLSRAGSDATRSVNSRVGDHRL
jgi:flagellar biogenesis protein FliO